MAGDGDDRKRREARDRQRHVDMADALDQAGAIDQRGVLELGRNGLEGLAHQEGAEGRGEERHHDAGERVVEAELDHQAQVRHDQQHRHQHQLHQEQIEDRRLAGEVEPRKGKARERDRDELHQEDAGADDRGVEEVAREVADLPGIPDVVERGFQARHQLGHQINAVGGRAQCGHAHPQERDQPGEREQDRQQEAELRCDLVARRERGVLVELVDQLHGPPSRFAMVRKESAVRAIRAASVSSVAAEALPTSKFSTACW